jgi:hypothetical protein
MLDHDRALKSLRRAQVNSGLDTEIGYSVLDLRLLCMAIFEYQITSPMPP